jgi:hypothetical protein
MKSLIKSLMELFTTSQPIRLVVEDPAVYQIETTMRKYCGKIIYQDDMMIKLKIAKPKAVKILKSNIERITIVQTELAKQYYQWQHTRLQV